jgi:hypothetical protein
LSIPHLRGPIFPQLSSALSAQGTALIADLGFMGSIGVNGLT